MATLCHDQKNTWLPVGGTHSKTSSAKEWVEKRVKIPLLPQIIKQKSVAMIKHYLFRVVLALLIAFCTPPLGGQTVKKTGLSKKEMRKHRPVYLSLFAGGSFLIGKDLNLSSRYFQSSLSSGTPFPHFPLDISIRNWGDRVENTYQIRFTNGSLTYAGSSPRQVGTSLNLEGCYYKLKRINPISNHNLNIKAGGGLGGSINIRSFAKTGNTGRTNDYIISLFLSVKVRYTLPKRALCILKKGSYISYQLNVSPISYFSRPGYTSLFGIESVLNNQETASGHTSINKFGGFQINSEFLVVWPVNSYLRLGNFYHWSARHLNNGVSKPAQIATHTLGVALFINMRNKKIE